jgi:hypothetical protein
MSLPVIAALRGSVVSASIEPRVSDSSEERPLQSVSFAVHVARGIIRDQKVRRRTMLGLLIAALVLLFCGSTFLGPVLNIREHPGWFLFFWLGCGWLTLSAMLLAIFDLLRVKLETRREQRRLSEEVQPHSRISNDPNQ